MRISQINQSHSIKAIKDPETTKTTTILIKNTNLKMGSNQQKIETLREKILLDTKLGKQLISIFFNHLIEITNQQIKNEKTEANLYSEKQIKLLGTKKNSIDNNFKKLEEKYQKAFEFTTQNTDEIIPKMNKIHDETIKLKEKITEEIDIYFSSDDKTLPDRLEIQNLSMTRINNLLIATQNKDN